jgi:LAS superfamily LD-carboxypeptidase LdcB
MKQAAEADGIPVNLMTVVSGFRSIAHQTRLWKAALEKYGSPEAARVWVAPPGHSAHHTGRAIDFHLGRPVAKEHSRALRRTAAYRWLVCNASRFGFTPYAVEPWHWEFNPPGFDPSLLQAQGMS